MLEIFIIILSAVLGAVMGVKRLTEKPFELPFTVTESSANTYTEKAINLPIVAILGRDLVQAVEVMALRDVMQPPDLEDGQANVTQAGLRRDSGSTPDGLGSADVIDERRTDVGSTAADGSEGQATTIVGDRQMDFTDRDGNGVVLTDRTIYAYVKGTGNGSAKTYHGKLSCHLVEVDGADVAVQQIIDDN